ncbi:MAG: hypothetical protein AB7F50_10130 [Fimbriimonadaceae bacterium]
MPIATLCLVASLSLQVAQGTDVLMRHNDGFRTGWNRTEAILTPTSVASQKFRLLFTLPAQGHIYAQPLVVSGVQFVGSTQPIVRDLCLIATAHNSVYCYDTRPAVPELVWERSLGPSVPWEDVGSQDVHPEIGIIATPVIDRATMSVWITAKTKELGGAGDPVYRTRLHRLDLRTGVERPNSPVELQGDIEGTAPDAVEGRVYFNPLTQMNRPGLLIHDNVVYVAFGGHGDNDPYHGWVFAYHATKLEKLAVYCTTPEGDPTSSIPSGAGGIWNGGEGLACDEDGGVYFSSGNGGFSKDPSGRQTGNSYGRLVYRDRSFHLSSFFTPVENDTWNPLDYDLGTSGVLLVPGTDLALGGGKTQDFFVMRRNALGGYSASGNLVLQQFNATSNGVVASPAYFDSPVLGPLVYLGGKGDVIRAYRVFSTGLEAAPASVGKIVGPWPGSGLSVSSNGTDGGVLWAIQRRPDWNAVLRAFDANDLAREIWNSDLRASDEAGAYVKFNVPTVANGLVFVATRGQGVKVYGIRPQLRGNQD